MAFCSNVFHFGICLPSATEKWANVYFVSYDNFVSRYENEDGITFKSFNAKGRGLASEDLKEREM